MFFKPSEYIPFFSSPKYKLSILKYFSTYESEFKFTFISTSYDAAVIWSNWLSLLLISLACVTKRCWWSCSFVASKILLELEDEKLLDEVIKVCKKEEPDMEIILWQRKIKD